MSFQKMREKRQHVRFKVNGSDIIARMMLARKVEINDISVNGVSLKADRRIEIGRVYQLKLECRNEVLPVNGVVIWSRLNEMSKTPAGEMVPIYKAGLRFRFAADSGIMRELIDFIRDKLLDNEGSRIVNPKNE
jgi:hypothetical protein